MRRSMRLLRGLAAGARVCPPHGHCRLLRHGASGSTAARSGAPRRATDGLRLNSSRAVAGEAPAAAAAVVDGGEARDGGRRDDVQFMREALQLAMDASAGEDVPVAAIIVQHDCARGSPVLARGVNARVAAGDPLAHAEVVAMREAAAAVGGREGRLDGCDMYVTLEPCTMCFGAAVQARLRRVVYAAPCHKHGAAGGAVPVAAAAAALPHVPVVEHLGDAALEQACGNLLRDFFRRRRKENAEARGAERRARSR